MTKEKVCLIIPAYNGARFLRRAIESVLRQEWPNLEVIVVDDGSTDDLAAAVKDCGCAVRYMAQPRRGPSAARNLGLRHASPDAGLIAFLDVDDTWMAGHLNRLHEALTLNPEAEFAQGMMRQITTYPDGRSLLSGAYRMHSLAACLFRRALLDRLGGLDEGMQLGEDYDLFCRCWERDVARVCVDEVSLLYHRHGGNITIGHHHAGYLAVVQRRAQRVRQGLVDPAESRRFPFDGYSGSIGNFWKDQVEVRAETCSR